MFQLKKRVIDTKIIFTRFAYLSLLTASYCALADGNENLNTKNNFVYDSLKSIQIQCFSLNEDSGNNHSNDTTDLKKMLSSQNTEDRIHALSQLATDSPIDSGFVQEILQQGLTDQDARVRAQAIYALSKQNCNNADLILQQALQDGDLSVRMMALDSLGSNTDEINLLKHALEDEEQAIRELAQVKLATISAQNNNNSKQ